MNADYNRQKAFDDIDHTFKDLFSAQGIEPRPAQVALCHEMLGAMLGRDDRAVRRGDGERQDLRLPGGRHGVPPLPGRRWPAAPAHRHLHLQHRPAKRGTERIPALSLDYPPARRPTGRPLRAVIRNGKAHYVCDERLEQRLRQVDLNKKNQRARVALLSLRHILDMYGTDHPSGYNQERICIPSFRACRGRTAGTTASWTPVAG